MSGGHVDEGTFLGSDVVLSVERSDRDTAFERDPHA